METCTACHRLFRRRGGLHLHVYNSPSCLNTINQVQQQEANKVNMAGSTSDIVNESNENQQYVDSVMTDGVLMDIEAPNDLEADAFPLLDDSVTQDIPTGLLEQSNERMEHSDYMVTSLQDSSEIELLRLVRSINAPLYAYNHINN